MSVGVFLLQKRLLQMFLFSVAASSLRTIDCWFNMLKRLPLFLQLGNKKTLKYFCTLWFKFLLYHMCNPIKVKWSLAMKVLYFSVQTSVRTFLQTRYLESSLNELFKFEGLKDEPVRTP